jgi:outer membrane translocation and assembly module TamA
MDAFGESREIPLNERYFTGGPTSLRAFGYQMVGPLDAATEPLGGGFKLVCNLVEIRQSLYKMFGGVVFMEFGNVWPTAEDFRPDDLRVSLGSGLRLNSPLGIVRCDLGINVDRRPGESRSKIYISMGQAF